MTRKQLPHNAWIQTPQNKDGCDRRRAEVNSEVAQRQQPAHKWRHKSHGGLDVTTPPKASVSASFEHGQLREGCQCRTATTWRSQSEKHQLRSCSNTNPSMDSTKLRGAGKGPCSTNEQAATTAASGSSHDHGQTTASLKTAAADTATGRPRSGRDVDLGERSCVEALCCATNVRCARCAM